MVGVQVEQSTLDRIHSILAGVENAEERVLKPAFTRGLMAAKTTANRQIRTRYHISSSEIKNNSFISMKNVSKESGGIVGNIQFSGTVIPLYKFDVTPNKPTYGTRPIKISVLKDGGGVSRHKFVAQMKSGHLGVFERLYGQYPEGVEKHNKHTESIEEKKGPSVPKMVGSEKTMKPIEERVAEVINQRIDHEIDRLFNGIGG